MFFYRGMFSRMMRLEQSRVSEYILWSIILISSFFEKHFRIKTSGKKRRFDLSEIIFKLKKKTNEIYIYKYKLGRENVK